MRPIFLFGLVTTPSRSSIIQDISTSMDGASPISSVLASSAGPILIWRCSMARWRSACHSWAASISPRGPVTSRHADRAITLLATVYAQARRRPMRAVMNAARAGCPPVLESAGSLLDIRADRAGLRPDRAEVKADPAQRRAGRRMPGGGHACLKSAAWRNCCWPESTTHTTDLTLP